MSCTPQVSTVFVNHVVPFQHTDTGKKMDVRCKVTPEIGVTIQNSGYFDTKFKHRVLNWLLAQLRDKLPYSFNSSNNYSKFTKEDGTTTNTELRDRHMYMLMAKFYKKTFEDKQVTWSTHEIPMQNYKTLDPRLVREFWQHIFTSTFSFKTVSHFLPSTWPHKPA